nr:xylose isomerase [Gammaproteobacteria bacterium]
MPCCAQQNRTHGPTSNKQRELATSFRGIDMLSRRSFIRQSSLALAAMSCVPALASSAKRGPLGKPIGIQLYTVRHETQRDLRGTLAALSEIGYREVEMAGYYDMSAKELRKLLTDLNLTPTSTHQGLPDLLNNTQRTIDYIAELGAKYVIVPFPAVPDNRFDKLPPGSTQTIANSMTLDDWKWIADQLNRIGEISKKSGIVTGYHNHNMEFRTIDGVVAYDQLLAWTDPSLVTMELDIAWVVAAGFDPIHYLTKHADRISLLHIKDVKKDIETVVDVVATTTTELGNGKIDWKNVFAACNPDYIKHYYYEQEHWDGPVLEAAKKSFEYLIRL